MIANSLMECKLEEVRTGFPRQCHNVSGGILEALKTGSLVVRKTAEKSIAVVKPRSNKCIHE